MDRQLLVICFLTFVIHIIGTLAYSVRIAGIRTRRIAVSLSLFSILVLVSRTANSFLGPFLAKRVESRLGTPLSADSLLLDFRCLLVASSLATVAGALLVPTFQRLFARAVEHFQVHRSVPKLLFHGLFKGGPASLRGASSMPRLASVTGLRDRGGVTLSMSLLNVVAVALWTVGVFASLYAGVVDPAVRVTSSTLSSIVNGGATVMMAVCIDPHMSAMTDDVIDGRLSESRFRRAIIWLVGTRLAGTVLAQALLVPSALLIVAVAKAI